MKRLRANRKAVVGWTLFFHLLLLVVVARYRLARHQQKPWADEIARSVTEKRERPQKQEPDPLEPELENVEELIQEARAYWDGRSVEARQLALNNRETQLGGIPEENLVRIVERINRSSGSSALAPLEVPLSELDLSTGVPIHMHRGNDEAGRPGIWIEFQDEAGRVAKMWVEEEQLSPEELRALQAFSILERNPALQGLRPVLSQMLRRFTNP